MTFDRILQPQKTILHSDQRERRRLNATKMCEGANIRAAAPTPKMASPAKPSGRRCLIEGAGYGPWKTFFVMLYSHFAVALLCLNVGFDLLFFGVPVYLLHIIGLLPNSLYLKITSFIMNWTTPIVFAMPMVFSGSKLYTNDIDLLVEDKSKNSLLLTNHGSRIDWMVAMFVGFNRTFAGKACGRARVGFVCEALIQFMPLIGWYRKVS